MIIAVPKEIKEGEHRVAQTPAGVATLTRAGHRVLVQAGAGHGSGFSDEEYRCSGAEIVTATEEVFTRADLVVKVKEPLPEEYTFLREDMTLFTYLHLAAAEELLGRLCVAGTVAIGYETVQLPDGSLPLLAPMSEIAGKVAMQVGVHYLENTSGGSGKLLGGVAGVEPGNVTIIGGGIAGAAAAAIALGMGGAVTILDVNVRRLRYLGEVLRGNLITLICNPYNVARAVERADVVIGAVLIPGAKAPHLVTREVVQAMPAGSVVVDVSIDQGGCIETSRPTSLGSPVYCEEGVIHYGVPNMPSVVARTSTQALSDATLPYVLKLANLGVVEALRQDPALRKGLNTWHGKITCQPVADAFGLPFMAPRFDDTGESTLRRPAAKRIPRKIHSIA